jgi:hypothetical protein
MQLLSHITYNEVAVFLGVFLLGVAAGAMFVWQLVRRRIS